MDIGKAAFAIKLDDQVTAAIDQACKMMETTGNKMVCCAIICAMSLVGHAYLIYRFK